MFHNQHQQQQLIPCIPDEIATECLVRIPHRFHSTLKLVSHGWRSLLSDSSFYSHRVKLGAADHLIFLVQPLPVTNSANSTPPPPPTGAEKAEQERRLKGPPAYALGVFNLTRGEWHRLEMSTASTDSGEVRIPMFCQVVSIPTEGKLLLLGGWDPDTLEPVTDVYVIDLVSGSWRRGAPMAAPRSFFAVAVAAGRVYVAGGHDGQKNALRSAEVYDLAADGWAALPPMAEERDECLGMASGGGFMVVSGYATDNQGRFREDAEWFDPGAGRWSKIEGVWPFSTASPRATAAGGRRWWWLSESGEVMEFDWEEMRWKAGRKIRMPRGFGGGGGGSSLCVVDVGGGAFFVMGSGGAGGGEGVFAVEAEGSVWKQVETPAAFLGLPFSSSHMLI